MKVQEPSSESVPHTLQFVQEETDLEVSAGESNWEESLLSNEKDQSALRIWKGLIWCEWFSHSYLLLTFLGIWLAGIWILPLVAHPGWILLVAAVFAMMAGPAYGGGDVVEGSEEFTLALPATRSERFIARLIVGGSATLFFSFLDLACLQLDWSQAIGRFFLDTRILSATELSKPGLIYGFSLTFPFTIFATSFVVASLAHVRPLALSSWLIGGLAALVWIQVGNWYETWVWGEIRGWCTALVCLIWSFSCLWVGYRFYCLKEVGPETQPAPITGKFWLYIGACTVVFLIFLALAGVFFRKLSLWISG